MATERSPKRQKVSISEEHARFPELSLQPTLARANNDQTLNRPQRSSWFNSWSRKAAPVTEVARESIRSVSATSTKPPDSPKPKSIRSPSLAMTLGKKQPNRGIPVDATTSIIHAEASSPSGKKPTVFDSTPEAVAANKSSEGETAASMKEPVVSSEEQSDTNKPDDTVQNGQPGMQRNSWLGWMGKSEVKTAATDAQSTCNSDTQIKSSTDRDEVPPAQDTSSDANPNPAKDKQARRSWLPWSYDEVIPSTAVDQEPAILSEESTGEKSHTPGTPLKPKAQALPIKGSGNSRPDSTASSMDVVPPPSLPHDGSKASAWAFWSRERKANSSSASIDRPHEGEIAISDTPSQGKPKRASFSVPNTDKMPVDKPTATKPSDVVPPREAKDETLVAKAESQNATATAPKVPEQKQSPATKSLKAYQNVLLPDLHSTLKLPANPSIVQQLSRLLYITKEPELKHLSLVKDPPKIHNALAIGVHGYFPAPFIRTVIGQPTGTSIKFADMASRAIKRWTKARNYDCTVKTAALEGEGKIAERVDLLWKLLLNWIEEIRKSDFVLVSCHSQGVPVAIMLVARLIQFGCLSHARVGVLAMAGISMGPFAEYKSRFIGGSAGELFEFSNPDSKVSQEYLSAVEAVLKFGARVTFIGSIDDQLVSLESSIFSSLSHPHIYRAVSIDARLHAPTFLSHLVGFALKLRNLGIQDHGLIKELSSPLAGSLYTGDGHSRIYESDNCYDMAVDWSLLTTSMLQVPVVQRPATTSSNNPYILPFAMRGILEEEFVRTELQSETSELLRQFDEWKPTTKVLKDVKFRLEGIRSKL